MPTKFKNDWDTLTRINFLQRKIIIASIAYYELDEYIMSDFQYDDSVKQLKELMNKCEEKEQSRYWYVYKDWTGATGCFLYSHLNEDDKRRLLEDAKCTVKTIDEYRNGRY